MKVSSKQHLTQSALRSVGRTIPCVRATAIKLKTIAATTVPSLRLEKKQKVDLLRRHALCDALLSYTRNS